MTEVITDFYADAGDGSIYISYASGYPPTEQWDYVHDASTGDGITSGNTMLARVYYSGGESGGIAEIERVFMTFDTSAIPLMARIISATLYVYCEGASEVNFVGDASIVQSSQSNPTSLATSDYGSVGTTEAHDGGARIAYSSLAIGGWYSWAFNSTGLNFINKGSWTKLSIREFNADINDVTPSSGGTGIATFHTANTAEIPYLRITYIVGAQVMQVY
jgi:hypothetical protein